MQRKESKNCVTSEFDDPRLDDIHRYWLEKHRDGRLPRRADIKPAELGGDVRHVNLIDVLREPLRFRHRLVGSAIIEWLGRDITGHMVDETLYGPFTAEIIASLTRVVATRRPFRRLARLDWNNQKWLQMESVELPLAGDDGQVEMILRGAVFRPGTEPLGERLHFTPLGA